MTSLAQTNNTPKGRHGHVLPTGRPCRDEDGPDQVLGPAPPALRLPETP